ncbi:MAG: TolC family protein [Magnetococcales bacterium]|nr:TolC family protein [Magnetococcales bacterium]
MKRRLLLGCAVALMTGSLFVGSSQAETAGNQETAAEPATPVETLLDRVLTHQDHEVPKVIREVLDQLRDSGAWREMDGGWNAESLVFIDPNQVLLAGLRKNLSLHRGSLDAARVGHAIQEAEAVFDPVFQLTLGHSASMQYDRKRTALMYYKYMAPSILEHDPGIGGLALYDPRKPGPHVNEIAFGEQKSSRQAEEIAVSTRQKGNPFLTHSESLGISQQLPWGAVLNLTQTLTRKRNYDTVNDTRWHAPWGGSLEGQLMIPLPFTRNFGRLAPQDVAIKQAGLAKEGADWALRSQINRTLLQMDLAYWNLAERIEILLADVANQRVAKDVADAMARKLDAGRVTLYGKQQADAELARARTLITTGWKGVLEASHALAVLIEDDAEQLRNRVYLPMGFHARMEESAKTRLGSEMLRAIKDHPDMQGKEAALRSNDLEVEFRKNQTRPDLAVNAAMAQSHDNSVYGYEHLGAALTHLDDPDKRTQKYGITFTRTLGNRAAETDHATAKLTREMNRVDRRALENGLSRALMDAAAGLSGAAARLETAQANEALARQAEQAGRRRWETMGDVSEVELVLKQRDLHRAILSQVTARMDLKRAESRLFAAQGSLAQALGHQNAMNDFDRYRLQLLSDSGALPNLHPRKEPVAGSGS